MLGLGYVEAGNGPVEIVPLINKKGKREIKDKDGKPTGKWEPHTHNTSPNSMHLKYWVTCETNEDGEGKAYINMISNLRIAKPPVKDTIIHSGSFLISQAGSKKNWDVGLCSLTYKDDISEIKPPTIQDYFF